MFRDVLEKILWASCRLMTAFVSTSPRISSSLHSRPNYSFVKYDYNTDLLTQMHFWGRQRLIPRSGFSLHVRNQRTTFNVSTLSGNQDSANESTLHHAFSIIIGTIQPFDHDADEQVKRYEKTVKIRKRRRLLQVGRYFSSLRYAFSNCGSLDK